MRLYTIVILRTFFIEIVLLLTKLIVLVYILVLCFG